MPTTDYPNVEFPSYRTFFPPNHLPVFILHRTDMPVEEIYREIIQLIDQYIDVDASKLPKGLESIQAQIHLQTHMRTPSQLTLLTVVLPEVNGEESYDLQCQRLLRYVTAINQRIPGKEIFPYQRWPSSQQEQSSQRDNRLLALLNQSFEQPLIIASPNWYVSGAPNNVPPIGSGGPSGLPIQSSVPPFPPSFRPWGINLGTSTPPNTSNVLLTQGQGVRVYILDSFPDSASNYEKPYVVNTNGTAELTHPIPMLPSFCKKPEDKEPITTKDLDDLEVLKFHGPFIASIISSMAPCAEIRKIDVMDDYGLSTMASLAVALDGIQKDIQAAINTNEQIPPIVVNISLCFSTPAEAIDDAWDNLPDNEHCRVILPNGANGKDIKDALIQSFNALYLLFEVPQTTLDETQTTSPLAMLAAVGNDRGIKDCICSSNADKMKSRYPASDTGVIGVAALQRDVQGQGYGPANYSNDADQPGLWAFGGEIDPDLPNQAFQTGIYGHLGNDPTGQPQYGWWAGTSFATAVASGYFACAFGGKLTTKEALDKANQWALDYATSLTGSINGGVLPFDQDINIPAEGCKANQNSAS